MTNLLQKPLSVLVLFAVVLAGCNPSSQKPDPDDGNGTNEPDPIQLPDPSYLPKANEAVIYYKRADHLDDSGRVNRDAYSGWGLHLWEDGRVTVQNELATTTDWGTPFAASGIDKNYGAIFVVPFNTDDWHDFMFIMHKGDDKDIGGKDWLYTRAELGDTIFTFEGVGKLYMDPVLEPPLEVSGASAQWLSESTLAYNAKSAANDIALYVSEDANLQIVEGATNSIAGGVAYALQASTLSTELQTQFPHLSSWSGWSHSLSTDEVKAALKGQLWLAEVDADGEVIAATLVQTPGVLDDVYADAATAETFGATYVSSTETNFALWAPTAQSVSLQFIDGATTTTEAMSYDPASGVWSYASNDDLLEQLYRYQITVYHHETDSIETLTVTDPYSLSLSTNSTMSQVVDLNNASLLPTDWATSDVAETYNPEDISVYESHIRDFSINDSSGTPSLNGKYGAFAEGARESVQHLHALRDAGLTHLHLLPAFDIATINEDTEHVVELQDPMSELCAANATVAADYATECASGDTIEEVMAAMDPTTGDVQQLNGYLRNLDSFNWGYDPFHYTVPEGSYATDSYGSARILEFREMVKALHDEDLMVVMDVVYNHTNASGLSEKSVLDKIVPGYYHRRNELSGTVETSTCCANTASEHRMFEKLMIDSLIVWARDYKIDAFRFDLMGHHMKSNMENALTAVQAVRPHVYFYGEGWDFGEVGQNKRGENASQTNLAGTGIGTFTDRLRDAVRGGGPFDGGEDIRANQGFGNAPIANELSTDASAFSAGLLEDMDIIRTGLAGNIKTFSFEDRTGSTVTGAQVDYNGSPAAYVDDPQETVNYVSKHDNQTLWDNNMYKMPSSTTSAQRARLQAMALSIPLFSQGVPFIHMGSELLRSKSMSRDSYDSGDWFNAVNFDGTDNNWNVGLPRENVDGSNWELIRTIIEDANANPTTTDIALTSDQMMEWLSIRYSSELFRLTTAAEVNSVVSFHNTGASQTPGVIVMQLTDTGSDIDPLMEEIVVVFNATNASQTMTVSGASGYSLHPTLASSADTVVRTASTTGNSFTVPALTTAVFTKATVF